MIDPETITHDNALDVFRAAYTRRVGVGHEKMSYGQLSDTIGVQVRTLKSWRDSQSMPHMDSLLKLCVVFGPDFTSEILTVAGQGGVENIDPSTRSNAHAAAADITDVLAEITTRLRDGVFCHRDKAATAPLMLDLSHKLEEQAKAMLSEVPR
ncbi:MAG: hypothetical protein HOE78_03830 [Gammaproteobacteria bacterium]|jgi:hypothetical protein|nr:hypothetical protein [Gammaproteobacteria bacterium]